MTKEYWITNSRFKIIIIVLILFWLGIMLLFYLKADEVTHNPCEVCSKKIGKNVICTPMNSNFSIIFYPNMSSSVNEVNFTVFN